RNRWHRAAPPGGILALPFAAGRYLASRSSFRCPTRPAWKPPRDIRRRAENDPTLWWEPVPRPRVATPRRLAPRPEAGDRPGRARDARRAMAPEARRHDRADRASPAPVPAVSPA